MNTCTRCRRKIVNGAKQCETCLLKKTSSGIFGNQERWKDLANIYLQQNQVCHYSGFPLKIGTNASIDHTLAVSRGGNNDLSNLKWVHLWVNLMKNATKEDDFLEEFDNFIIWVYNHRQLYKKASS